MASGSVKPERSGAYFFCGVGGSGMFPLAAILANAGVSVSGSDRSRDQGQSPEKFQALEKLGVRLFPQDGSGVSEDTACVVVSSAVEETIPDVMAARAANVPVKKRAEILAEMFNTRKGIAIGGTSGKTTVTGMAARIMDHAGFDPAVVNGGAMINFADPEHGNPGSFRAGRGEWFVAETDESDGSIALYTPEVALLNNITLDHKPVEELRGLFMDFLSRARMGAVVNGDDVEARALKGVHENTIVFGIDDSGADLRAENLSLKMDGSHFTVLYKGGQYMRDLYLPVPGRHNVLNALAAIGTAIMAGVRFDAAVEALESFLGIRRRLEVLGVERGITVIDDFAHNPDKIAASLATLRQAGEETGGRLIIMFQPHGFGPMKMMRTEITEAFAQGMRPQDMLVMPEIFYAGGSAARDISSADLINDIKLHERKAFFIEQRPEIRTFLNEQARPGDCVVIMGARDDTLTSFARLLLHDFAADAA